MNDSVFAKSVFRGLIFVGFFLFSYSASAQTPEGKWKEISSKQFLTEQGIQSYGRSFLESDMSVIGVVTYSFLSDHTYQVSSKSVRNPSARIFNGTWLQSGNQLTLTSNGKDVICKMTILNDVLTLDTAYPNSDITTNVITTFKKI